MCFSRSRATLWGARLLFLSACGGVGGGLPCVVALCLSAPPGEIPVATSRRNRPHGGPEPLPNAYKHDAEYDAAVIEVGMAF